MISSAEFLKERSREGGPVRIALIGTGPHSSRIAAQIAAELPEAILTVVAGECLHAGRRVMAAAGLRIPRVIESAFGLRAAINSGEPAVTSNWRLLCDSPLIDVVIEATEDAERAREIVSVAAAAGKYVIPITSPAAAAASRKPSAARTEVVRLNTDPADHAESPVIDGSVRLPGSDGEPRVPAVQP